MGTTHIDKLAVNEADGLGVEMHLHPSHIHRH